MATHTRLAPALRALALAAALAGGLSPALAAGPEAPPLLLAEVFRGDVALADYWVSEKLDGARALWDGQRLRFRSGRPVPAPAWFVAGLPPEPLDGELWIGRGRFAELSGIVRRQQPVDDEWRQVRFMVCELPGAAGSFTERVEHLKTRLDAVVAAGGEGLMLHRADAPYLTGRSDALLKLKPRLDAEATVVAHLPGRGRLAGMMGALLVETPAGVRFQLGTGFTDAERREPPPVGAQVTYIYRELTRAGVPRFASYWRRREAF